MVNNRKRTPAEDTWRLAMGKKSPIPGITFFDGEKAKEDVEKAKQYADTGSKVLQQIKKLADSAKKALSKIGLGGSDQDRLIKRYYEIKDFLKAQGYDPGSQLGSWLDKYNIRKTDLKNNQKQPYWKAAYERLRQFTITWLNYKNPQLGDAYSSLFPEWKMANEGQIQSEPIDALKLLVETYPPGSYKGGVNGVQSLIASAPAAAGRSSEGGPVDETKKAEIQQTVAYVTLGLAMVLLIIAIVVHLKKNQG